MLTIFNRLLSVGVLALPLLAFADDTNEISYSGTHRRSQQNETARKRCPDALLVGEINIHCGLQGRVAPHLEMQNGYYNFFVDGSYLYWQGKEDNLNFGFVSDSSENKLIPNSVDFEWGSGLKLGLGYVFGWYDQWDLGLNWTYFHNKGHGKAKSSATRTLISGWFPNTLGVTAASSSVNWNLVYNALDLEIGRDYFISKAITVHPHAGLRGVFIEQNYDLHDDGAFFQEVLVPSIDMGAKVFTFTTNTGMDAKNDFKAIGLRTGADFLWHFTNHLGFYSNLSASLVYGEFKIDQDFATASVSSSLSNPFILAPIGYEEKFDRLRTNIEGSLGLTFETDFLCNNHLFFSVGYDFVEWFNQLQLSDFFLFSQVDSEPNVGSTPNFTITSIATAGEQERRYGDLMMQGLEINLRLDF